MLQKTVIKRQNKIVVGISYEYSNEEVEQFILAKMFKDVGYTYSEIKKEMDSYKNNRIEVLDKAISKTTSKIEELNITLQRVYELKKKVEEK